MTIDIPTLLIIITANCLLVGTVFVTSWMRSRSPVQGRVGSAAFLLAGGAMLLLSRGRLPDWASIDLANALILLAHGVIWSGVRIFEGRSAPPLAILAGVTVWVVASLVPAIHDSMAHRIAVISGISAVYTFACAYELARNRSERLEARTPLAALTAFHGMILAVRSVYALFATAPAGLFEGSWIQRLFIVEPAVMLMAFSVLGVALVRERSESALRRTAETDELTGALNRRAIFAAAGEAFAQAKRNSRPVALLLFDLDHFKAVNDRFGHSAGDAALRVFARVAGRSVRQTDLFARIGGEEFAMLLPGADDRTAQVIAERIRHDFAREAVVAGAGGSLTVSAGVASAPAALADFEGLMLSADKALYEAKRSGRDRVTRAVALAS